MRNLITQKQISLEKKQGVEGGRKSKSGKAELAKSKARKKKPK